MNESCLKADGVQVFQSLESHGRLESGGIQRLNFFLVRDTLYLRNIQYSYRIAVFYQGQRSVFFLPIEIIVSAAGDQAGNHYSHGYSSYPTKQLHRENIFIISKISNS